VPRNVLLRLIDVQDSIREIEKLVASASFEAFAQSWGMQRAVERGLEIISEASRHLSDEYKAQAPDVPWRQIAAIGNLLRHEYQRVDISATWNILKEHLPRLAEATDRLIAEENLRERPQLDWPSFHVPRQWQPFWQRKACSWGRH
jgi:uncharacterized protein with HEPN domain